MQDQLQTEPWRPLPVLPPATPGNKGLGAMCKHTCLATRLRLFGVGNAAGKPSLDVGGSLSSGSYPWTVLVFFTTLIYNTETLKHV